MSQIHPCKVDTLAKKKYIYDYPKADHTVDAVVFGYDPKGTDGALKVLLIKRGNPNEAYYDFWALPGGYVNVLDETLDEAVKRELMEETEAEPEYLEQLYTFGDPGRDPRGPVISTAYFALVRKRDFKVKGRDDAKEAKWVPINMALESTLAFDHAKILGMAHSRLQGKVRYAPIGFNLLPTKFSLGALQQLYEAILWRLLDKRNFRKKILAMGILKKAEVTDRGVPGKAIQLYRFDKDAYDLAVKNRFNFEI